MPVIKQIIQINGNEDRNNVIATGQYIYDRRAEDPDHPVSSVVVADPAAVTRKEALDILSAECAAHAQTMMDIALRREHEVVLEQAVEQIKAKPRKVSADSTEDSGA